MEITFQYQKKRTDFGRQALFCEQGPDMCDSLATHAPEHKQYILRNPVHQATQNTPASSEHFVNTIRADYSSSGADHSEGGWPRDVNVHDPEATQRYRRKIEKDDGYIHCVMSLASGMEHYVLQNNAIDMYHAYYSEMESLPPIERSSARTVNIYRDLDARPLGSLSWQPEGGHRFAATYLEMDSNRVPRGSTVAYQWEVEEANSPELVFTPPCALLDLQYSPREPQLLVGGLVSGQVAQFDARTSGAAQALCPPHVAHRDLVRKVLFINSKSGMEIFSGGPDGACKWWDLRNLSEPTDEMIMDVVKTSTDVQSMATANGISVLEYESTIPTRFMVGTENGLVISGNRKGKTPVEKLPAKYEAHLGPVWSVERNPNFLKNFLTVGDWRARVWSEECRESAVLGTPLHRRRLTGGAWSPTRLSLLLLAGADGALALWDLLRRQRGPVLTLQLCPEPLQCLRAQEAGSLVALGGRNGLVYMVELSHHLVETGKNDKALFTHVLDRESKRERILEARLREIRLKLRQAEERSPATSLTELDPTLGDRDLADATADYMQQVKKELGSF